MCDCLIVGDVMIMGGELFIAGEKIQDIPIDLQRTIAIGKFDYYINKKGNRVINDYEFVNGSFRKTRKPIIKEFKKKVRRILCMTKLK